MKKLKLLKKEQGELNTVYDIEVNDAHHYISKDGVIMHNSIGSFIPGQTISGGGGALYNASIILQLSKAGLKEGEIGSNGFAMKTGIIVTSKPAKNRFARPLPVKFHISFYKGMNKFVGLEEYLSWESCGIQKGKLISGKDFAKWKTGTEIYEKTKLTRWTTTDEAGVEKEWYFEDKGTARTIVVKHLCCEIKPNELFTSRVITDKLLQELDETVIKKKFMLPNIATLDDLAEIADDLDIDDTNESDNE